MRRIIYILACLPLLLASCRRDVASCDHHDLPEAGWAVTDTVQLTLNVADTTQAYDLALTLRHTDLYTYQNLWFFVQSPDTLCPIRTDTVQAYLADDRGRWLGARAGRYYNGYITMAHALRFPEVGTYTFYLVHGMRDSVIVGIADVGMELKAEQIEVE